jgi:hypothetical protein
MRRLLRFLPGFTLLFGMVSNAHACSCVGPGPVCSIQMGSSIIFRGTVVESTLIPNIRTVKRPDGTEMQLVGNGTFKVRLSVAETFSGEPKAEQIIYTSQQGSACGFPFQVGREYVVFTYVSEAQLWTSRCSRTALLEPGAENAAVTWMRAYKTAPHGSEISGSLRLPLDSNITAVPATIQLSGPDSRTVMADGEGRYVFRNLKAGEYSVAALVPDGFATSKPTKITVADKGCAEMNWPVTNEGRIRGNVVDADGRPVADMRMELQYASGARMNSSHIATTDLNGSYEFEHLSPGDYLVAARNPGYLTEDGASTIYYPHSPRPEARTIALGPAATVDRVDFVFARLRSTPSVRVNVVLPDGSPAPAGLYLYAFPNGSSGDEPTRTGLTDASGSAVLPLSLGREYAISVALDREHPGCGGTTLTFSDDKKASTVVINHPEACAR